MTTDLPQLRPLGRGKAYYDELRALYESEGPAIKQAVEEAKRTSGTLTIEDACVIALRHRMRLAAVFSFLEDECGVPCGTYDRLKERGLKPMAMLTEVWAGLSTDLGPLAPDARPAAPQPT